MKKDIKDYLHFHIGCEVFGTYLDNSGSKGILTGVTNGGHECEIQFILEDGFNVEEQPVWNDTDEVKILLRPLSDMTHNELKEFLGQPHLTDEYCLDKIPKIAGSVFGLYNAIAQYGNLNTVQWLLSKGFDLFGLIEDGLAIDKTKLKQPA